MVSDKQQSDTILEMKNIVKTFPGVRALDGVNLSVKRGEVHAICGENGAGKSTLMKVLSGVYPHGSYEGDILVNGKKVAYKTIRDSEHDGVVIIHQELALIPYLSIAENIFLGNEQKKNGYINWYQTNAKAAELLAKVGLSENPSTPIINIGIGKQQLVEIAKALSKNVSLLILDEPTAALNDEDSAHLLDLIRAMKAEGMTCIIISHKLNEIAAIADQTTIIRDGKSIETMPMTGPDAASEDRIIKGMVGRDISNRYPPRDCEIGEEVFRTEDWTVFHPNIPGRIVVDHANINVRAGEVVGIAGLMGAGRTELARSIFGKSWGTGISGKIYLHNKEVKISSVQQAIAAKIAYASEDRKIYGLNLIDDIKHNTTSAALHKIAKRGVVQKANEFSVADEFKKLLNTKAPSVDSVVGKLSGGNQQKVVLAKWMFADPDLLILDEPCRGIDIGAKFEIYTHINALAAQGKAVLVISSELPELLGICDRIYALNEGRITGQLPREEANQEELMKLMTKEKEAVSNG